MKNNQKIQGSSLFDDSVSYINTSSNNSNIVHKNSVTSFNNNSKKSLNIDKYNWFTTTLSHNNALSLMLVV
ncbi:MAG: hypothetical protein ACI9TV_001640 [Sulfurimonas sp.]|jgi:hypothetical protein|uniref:hypothetical protein n=1 Tax=Sulfurimonas sp. TaxID=2022749 RepID=UPI0039E3D038